MPNRTCWDVYIIHLNNTNVSMLHLLFIFAFFIMLCLFLCIFLFSFRLVFVQALFAVWQPFRFYCFTLQFSVCMVFNALMWCYSRPNPRILRFSALFTLLFCAISFKLNPDRLLVPVPILCIVEHIACLILEGVAGYVERIRQAICRQANERWKGNDGNNLK